MPQRAAYPLTFYCQIHALFYPKEILRAAVEFVPFEPSA